MVGMHNVGCIGILGMENDTETVGLQKKHLGKECLSFKYYMFSECEYIQVVQMINFPTNFLKVDDAKIWLIHPSFY